MGIVLLMILIAVGYYVYTQYARGGRGNVLGQEKSSAREIAEKRYARGEIDREEFERIMEDLHE